MVWMLNFGFETHKSQPNCATFYKMMQNMLQFGWSITFACNLQSILKNDMAYGYKAIMSTLDGALKCSINICPLLPQDLKFRQILRIYVKCEVWTASFQCIKLLKKLFDSLKHHQIPGGNVKIILANIYPAMHITH